MAITPKPKAPGGTSAEQAQIDEFINKAPDGNKSEKRGVKKGQREQITVTFDSAILTQLDELALHEGLSRAALIRMAVRQLLDKGAQVGG
ncbi:MULTISPECIES: ribbon-helix-helix domain-containing protein [Pantoea]|uniref:ribbon-helix-helix domain-containing protein n=1 Tax=Pantoea TaxID=53335 RepID=UPI00197D413E|nr:MULTISPECIES: ribbon-helix-helix domain-containing protein [Pantoea]WRH15685.1 ribbon-helix-helix protein, CopG family [Pantoea sp. JZ2]